MKFIIPLLFVSFLSSQTYEIKGAQIKYYGSHFLHDWIGVSNDLNGNVFIDKNNSKYQVDLNITKKIKTSATIDIANGFVANGSFIINLKDFNIETPTLMLIKIDDIIKIEYFISIN